MTRKKSDYKVQISEWFVPIKGFFSYSGRITLSEEPAKPSLLIKYPLFAVYHGVFSLVLGGAVGIGIVKGLEALVKAL